MTAMNTCFSSGSGDLHTDDKILASSRLTRSEFNRGLGQHMTAQTSAPDFFVWPGFDFSCGDRASWLVSDSLETSYTGTRPAISSTFARENKLISGSLAVDL
jgi:hypothetical protein